LGAVQTGIRPVEVALDAGAINRVVVPADGLVSEGDVSSDDNRLAVL